MNSEVADTNAVKVEQQAVAWASRLRSTPNATDQAAFEKWYAADSTHAAAFDAVMDSWDTMGLAARTPAGRARRPFFAQPSARSTRRYALAAIAAAVLLCVGLLAINRAGGGDIALVPSAYASAIGQIRSVTLPDGSRMTLDSDSAVQAAFTASERRVTLTRGRARFSTAADPRRPFVIATANGAVKANGTVDVAITAATLTIAVLRGAGDIDAPTQDRSSVAKRISAGEYWSLPAAGSVPTIAPFKAEAARWTSGMLSFENTELAEVVTQVNRYGGMIVLADDAVRRLRFTGTVRPTEPDKVATLLAATFRLALRREGASFVLASPNR